MLEGLPPNNAAHMMRLVSDERRARAVADLIFESFEPAEAASTAFETDDPWPGGGRAWLMEAYFGSEPDEEAIRALIAAAADETTARGATFGMTEKRDWVANSLAGLKPVRAGRFLVHGRHDRSRIQANDVAIEIEAGLAFGTGHHGTTRGVSDGFRPPAQAPAAEARPRRRLRRGRARHRRRQGPAPQGLARRRRSGGGRRRQRQRRLNGVGVLCRAIVSRGVENAALREAAPYDLVFANILAKPLRLLAPSLAAVISADGDGIVSGLLLADVPGVLASWRAQGFHLAERIELEGWASLRLRR